MRPIILTDDVELEITVESRSENYMLTIDSTSNVLNTATKVWIKKADYNVKVIQRASFDFFETLRKKLLWGEDIRTYNQ
ncbi:hypothetical protein [Persicobacter diffluens]|uniref:NAD(+) kinase n=1 Tax=Persicobacter diffluens TaxID=981 RepID=A0AAN4W0P1_9BACT|nr:hypothetical protein PEDI_30150 [Persicobacter diffluens]